MSAGEGMASYSILEIANSMSAQVEEIRRKTEKLVGTPGIIGSRHYHGVAFIGDLYV